MRAWDSVLDRSGREKRLDEADQMALDLRTDGRRHDAAPEEASIRGAVEHVEEQDRVRGEHPESELRLGEAAAALPHPLREDGPRRPEDVAVDAERDVALEEPAGEQLRHPRGLGPEGRPLPHEPRP